MQQHSAVKKCIGQEKGALNLSCPYGVFRTGGGQGDVSCTGEAGYGVLGSVVPTQLQLTCSAGQCDQLPASSLSVIGLERCFFPLPLPFLNLAVDNVRSNIVSLSF